VEDPGYGVTVSGTGLEVPPPGVGLKTVIFAVLGVAISVAVIVAANWVAETKVVVRFEPFHLTLEVGTNPFPLTVRVKLPPPAVTETGLMFPMDGNGLATVKVWGFDVPPPGVGLFTVTLAVTPDAMSVAVMMAVTWVGET
jgi:hypothetical protein